MTSSRIVVIEDEPAIRRGVVDALRASGYEAAEAGDGDRGLEAASGPDVDLVLLDLLLPRRDGFSVLAELRKVRPKLPVIILTARGSEDDRVRGLKMGADDYVVKPFSARELLARVEAVLRRTVGQPPELRAARLGRAVHRLPSPRGSLVGARARRAVRDGGRDPLLPRFASASGPCRAKSCSAASGASSRAGLETRTVDMHIARLRTKLRDPSGRNHVEAILTVRAHGYMAGPDLIPLEQPASGADGPMRYWFRGKGGGALCLPAHRRPGGGRARLGHGGLAGRRARTARSPGPARIRQGAGGPRKPGRPRRAERARELDNKLRLALSLLDGRVLPLLIQEENRPYNHYSAVYASPLALVNTAGAWKPETVLEPSPLLSLEFPDWMLLHFQTDEDCHWGSPQLLSSSLARRLDQLGVEITAALAERQPARQQLLAALQANLPPRDLLTLVEQRGSQLEWRENTLVLTNTAKELNPLNSTKEVNPQGAVQGLRGANGDAGGYDNRQGQSQRVQNDSKMRGAEGGRQCHCRQCSPQWRGLVCPSSWHRRAGATVTIARGPLVPLWITTSDGQERLLVARAVRAGNKLICQGVILDWPRLQQVLGEEIAGLFPETRFQPMREPKPPHPERTMSALPVELDIGPADEAAPESIAEETGPEPPVLGWTPLRAGIGLAWAAALVALLAVGLGGWSLLDLSERRIRFVSAVTHELRTPVDDAASLPRHAHRRHGPRGKAARRISRHAERRGGTPESAHRQRARLLTARKSTAPSAPHRDAARPAPGAGPRQPGCGAVRRRTRSWSSTTGCADPRPWPRTSSCCSRCSAT